MFRFVALGYAGRKDFLHRLDVIFDDLTAQSPQEVHSLTFSSLFVNTATHVISFEPLTSTCGLIAESPGC